MNLTLKPDQLESLNSSLKLGNEKIITTIDNIHNKIRTLDETVWLSKEKKNMDDYLDNLLTKTEQEVPVMLNEMTEFIDETINKYRENNAAIYNAAKGV